MAVNWLYGDLKPHEVDPITLTWWMHRNTDPDEAPDHRVVIQVDHTAPEQLTVWMVFDRGEPSVCVQYQGSTPTSS